MSVYNKSIGTGKLGVNLLKSFIDENECYFHEILQENDVGIDAFIEFTKNGENDGRCIAVQIKTGNSFFNVDKSICTIPIGDHYNYWKNHSLQVYGIVCDCENKKAFWISITDFIKENNKSIKNGKIKTISFPVMEISTLDSKTFGTIFKPLIYGMLPRITFQESLALSYSTFLSEKEMAIDLLLKTYVDNKASWDRCLTMLYEEINPELFSKIVYYFSYVSYNPDLWGDLAYSQETKQYVKTLIQRFDKQLMVKMLSLTEDGIERGSIGQCVESLISIVPYKKDFLIEMIEGDYGDYVKFNAFLILSYYDSKFVLKREEHFVSLLDKRAETVIGFIKKFGEYELYI
ncbi:MAG: hypothetical protein H6Q69_3390 [Firmicutes bacterium]|nr:hypothetical protein [Bacillota bacterium]